MRFAACLLVGAGCNAVFGLDSTQLTPPEDAQFFDAHAGAWTCPAPGTSPAFAEALYPTLPPCFGVTLTEDGTRAVAACTVANGPKIQQGPVEGPLVAIPSLEVAAPLRRDQPRITPEGDQLFLREWNTGTTSSTIRVFDRSGEAYQLAHDVMLSMTLDSFAQFGSLTEGPTRRMFVRPVPSMSAFVEVSVAADGVATVVGTYTPQDFGVKELYTIPNLTLNGLALVVSARDNNDMLAVMYFDRADLNAPWSGPTPLVMLNTFDPYLAPGCGRLYFTDSTKLVYIERK